MFKILVRYPSREEERRIVLETAADRDTEVKAVLHGATIIQLQQIVRRIPVAPAVVDHALDLVRKTRVRDPEPVPDFIKRWLPASGVWVSDPTWDNHRAMFEGASVAVHTYPYYDAGTGGLKFEALLQTLRGLPSRSVVLLHACCHNPTGVDLTRAQWEALIPVLRERELLPFLDLAYQGYGDGIEEDAFAVRALALAGLTLFVANSFSKSMSVYGERAGALMS